MKNSKFLKFLYLNFVLITISFVLKNICLFLIDKNILVTNNFFELVFVKNTGAAFNLLQQHLDWLIWFSILTFFILFFYTFKYSKSISNLKLTSLTLISSGVACNTFERIFDGYVTDYLNFSFINFPVFNVSDIYITTGTILLIIVILFYDK